MNNDLTPVIVLALTTLVIGFAMGIFFGNKECDYGDRRYLCEQISDTVEEYTQCNLKPIEEIYNAILWKE